MRGLNAAMTDVALQLEEKSAELKRALTNRSEAERRARELQEELDRVAPPSLHGRCASIEEEVDVLVVGVHLVDTRSPHCMPSSHGKAPISVLCVRSSMSQDRHFWPIQLP